MLAADVEVEMKNSTEEKLEAITEKFLLKDEKRKRKKATKIAKRTLAVTWESWNCSQKNRSVTQRST